VPIRCWIGFRRIIKLCEEQLAVGVKNHEGEVDHKQLFRSRATLIEAFAGTGRTDDAESSKDKSIEEEIAKSLQDQLEKLDKLLGNPPH
jgi:hypothetical protein